MLTDESDVVDGVEKIGLDGLQRLIRAQVKQVTISDKDQAQWQRYWRNFFQKVLHIADYSLVGAVVWYLAQHNYKPQMTIWKRHRNFILFGLNLIFERFYKGKEVRLLVRLTGLVD